MMFVPSTRTTSRLSVGAAKWTARHIGGFVVFLVFFAFMTTARAVTWCVSKAVLFAWTRRHGNGALVVPVFYGVVAWMVAAAVAGDASAGLPALAVIALLAGVVAPALEASYRARGHVVPASVRQLAWCARLLRRPVELALLRRHLARFVHAQDLGAVVVWKARRVPAGWRLHACFPRGLHAEHFRRHEPGLASALGARRVRVTAHPDRGYMGTVDVIRRDPLADLAGVPWPLLNASRLDLWEPIPIGVDESGRPVTLSLFENNVLVGGQSGGGKSNMTSMLVATAALDPSTRLHLFDGKGMIELDAWTPCADSAAKTPREAVEVLDKLVAILDERMEALRGNGRKVQRGRDDLHLIVIDELAMFTAGNEHAKTINERLLKIVALGRALGIIILAASQKPESKIVPTNFRDNFKTRIAFRCGNMAASTTILGELADDDLVPSKDIPEGQEGTGLLRRSPGARPQLFRSYLVDDDHLDALAARAAALREREAPPLADPLDLPAAPSTTSTDAKSEMRNADLTPTPEGVVVDGSALPAVAGCAPVVDVGWRSSAVSVSVPPSLNDVSPGSLLWDREKKKLEAELAREWREVGLPAPLPGGRCRVTATLTFPVVRRRDEDNFRSLLSKATGDALQRGAWLPDDTHDRYGFDACRFVVDPSAAREARVTVLWSGPVSSVATDGDDVRGLPLWRRKELVEGELRRDSEQPDRRLGERFGMDAGTVRKIRAELGLPPARRGRPKGRPRG